jgi:hypothetical protein
MVVFTFEVEAIALVYLTYLQCLSLHQTKQLDFFVAPSTVSRKLSTVTHQQSSNFASSKVAFVNMKFVNCSNLARLEAFRIKVFHFVPYQSV